MVDESAKYNLLPIMYPCVHLCITYLIYLSHTLRTPSLRILTSMKENILRTRKTIDCPLIEFHKKLSQNCEAIDFDIHLIYISIPKYG